MDLLKSVEDFVQESSDQRRNAEKSRGEAVFIQNSDAEKAYIFWTFDKSWRVAEDIFDGKVDGVRR